ncbi:MAG: hypothetical protein ABI619_12705 [Betaproteobacteria bacterium]
MKFQIERSHAEEIDTLKSRHSQAIEEINRKHVAAIGTLKAEQAKDISTLQKRILELEKQQSEPPPEPKAEAPMMSNRRVDRGR